MKFKVKNRECTSYNLVENILLNRIYNARQVKSSQELDYQLKNLLSFDSLTGIEAGVQLLAEALQKQQKIVIVGDFDTDGASSTALAYLALKAFGFHKISYQIPDRFKESYGLTKKIVEKIINVEKPDLILTVDNGITHHEGVNLARENNIKVLITDHHLQNEIVPEANAIINPNQKEDLFPSKNLAGVGVVFYLMIAFRSFLRKQQIENNVRLADYLDLVALGTIADSVQLDYNNRILVANGLKMIRQGSTKLGILALLNIAKRDFKQVTTEDLAFSVVPRLNAAGRLENMELGVECLITCSNLRAINLAKNLDRLNETRKNLSEKMFKQVLERVDKEVNTICLFDYKWHQGIVGVVASKIKEQFNRPVVLFAPSVDQGEIKGSVRSIENLNIRDLIAELASTLPEETICRFGGHSLAAGITIRYKHWDLFKNAFEQAVIQKNLGDNEIEYLIDGELSATDLTLENALLLNQAGPFGPSFEEPLFMGKFILLRINILKEKHIKLLLKNQETGKEWEAIYFNAKSIDEFNTFLESEITILYKLGLNSFNQKLQVQLLITEAYNE